MTPHSDSVDATRKARRVAVEDFLCRIAKPVLVGLLMVLIFLLGQAMVHHRFFQGGRDRPNGTIGQ